MSPISLKSLAVTALSISLASATPVTKRDVVKGFDISHYQPNVDFSGAYSSGMRFVMIKATEATDYIDPSFSSHYDSATSAGFIRGGYHFARFADSSGATQANYFLAHGGGWTADGITLPGMLDLEDSCSGMSASDVVDWIKDFSDTYHAATNKRPILYFSPSWWSECAGDSTEFHTTNPLDMACWDSSPCSPPGGWPYWTFWQYADSNTYGGDSDEFNGDIDQLKKVATNTDP